MEDILGVLLGPIDAVVLQALVDDSADCRLDSFAALWKTSRPAPRVVHTHGVVVEVPEDLIDLLDNVGACVRHWLTQRVVDFLSLVAMQAAPVAGEEGATVLSGPPGLGIRDCGQLLDGVPAVNELGAPLFRDASPAAKRLGAVPNPVGTVRDQQKVLAVLNSPHAEVTDQQCHDVIGAPHRAVNENVVSPIALVRVSRCQPLRS